MQWAKLLCLAAHGTHLPQPTLEELGLQWIHKVCDRLWMYRSADFEPDITVPRHESQWRETCALAGSIAESLMLATASLVEIEWHERALRQKTEPAGMVLGQRYLADTVCETSIAVGHRLINLVARVLRTEPGPRQRMADHRLLAPLGPTYAPFSTEHRTAWLSLNTETLAALRKVAPAQPALHSALDALTKLISTPQWKSVFFHRAENFHRWRREHEYVAGVDTGSGSASDVHDHRGRVVGKRIGSDNSRYSAADGLGEQTVTNARSGVEVTAKAASAILTHILAALPHTAGLTLHISSTTYRISGYDPFRSLGGSS